MKKRKKQTFWMETCALWITDHYLLFYGSLLFILYITSRYDATLGDWGILIKGGLLLFCSLVTFDYPILKYLVSKLYEDS